LGGRIHIVQQGECLSRIAARYGFTDWHVVYDAPENAELRRLRPNPNVIHPGDRVSIPELRPREHVAATAQRHQFTVRSRVRELRIKLRDAERQPLANQPYRLTFGPLGDQLLSGTTDGEGLLSQRLPLDVEHAELELSGSSWTLAIGHLNPVNDARDSGVSGIQGRLANMGYDVGRIDGVIGPRTRAAIEAFQRDHPPLVVDGTCGPLTRARLVQEYGT